jgi:hypothetical protein
VQTSTWIAIFLLAFAASLASYWFSQWQPSRNERVLSWAGISLGTTLLVAAVAAVALALSFVASRVWRGEFFEADVRSADVGDLRGWAAVAYVGDQPVETRRDERPPPAAAATTTRAVSQPRLDDPYDFLPAPVEGAWAATACVTALHADLIDPTRWAMDNGCHRPVAIVIAVCAQHESACNAAGRPWTYREGGMILPGKIQRPVSLDEQTQQGLQLRYAACYVTLRSAIGLIAADSETRSSPEWAERFFEARWIDECLARVQNRSEAGRSSNLPLDVLIGEDLARSSEVDR